MQSWQRAGALIALVLTLGATARAQILIGQTAGFTGAVAAGVQETTEGARLYLDMVNARGGVHGQKIELVSLDDKFDAKLSAENARQLIEERGVSALFLTRGTPHTEAIIPLLDKHGVALVGPSTGAMVLHKPVRRNVFNVRATYQREAEKAITHLASMGITRIAVVLADDSFGADGLVGAQRGLDTAKLTPVAVERFNNQGKPDFGPIAPKIIQSQVQAVLMIASGVATADGYAAFRAAGSGAQIVTLSNNASAGFVKSLGPNARGVIVTQVYPHERSMNFPLVREAHELAKAKGKEITPAMLEGFTAAKVLVEGLRRAGPRPTRDRIQAALEGIQKFDVGGLEVSYGPDDHTGLDFADLSIIGTDGKFRR